MGEKNQEAKSAAEPKQQRNLPLPQADRVCVKCGCGTAYGPEYRRGYDSTLGEHLRFYCVACRFCSFEPTKDQDTPERRAEMQQAMDFFRAEQNARRMQQSKPPVPVERASSRNDRDRDIEQVRRESIRKPSYGWGK